MNSLQTRGNSIDEADKLGFTGMNSPELSKKDQNYRLSSAKMPPLGRRMDLGSKDPQGCRTPMLQPEGDVIV